MNDLRSEAARAFDTWVTGLPAYDRVTVDIRATLKAFFIGGYFQAVIDQSNERLQKIIKENTSERPELGTTAL
jgi:hypothetical protein